MLQNYFITFKDIGFDTVSYFKIRSVINPSFNVCSLSPGSGLP